MSTIAKIMNRQWKDYKIKYDIEEKPAETQTIAPG